MVVEASCGYMGGERKRERGKRIIFEHCLMIINGFGFNLPFTRAAKNITKMFSHVCAV